MNREEKAEIRELPDRYRPIGAWGYVGYSILFAIPVIGWLFLFVYALSGGNIARRSFARSYFLKFFLVVIIVGIVALVAVTVFGEQLKEIMAMVKEYLDQFKQTMPQ